jgi:hypothetical protein
MELHQWIGKVALGKITSQTGCLENEGADEQAELDQAADEQELCSSPEKYCSFWLLVKPIVRQYAEECQKQLPGGNDPNKSILLKAVAAQGL